MAKPDYTHPQYLQRAQQWRTMRDVIDGSDAVKQAGTRYLPMPGAILPSDTAEQIAAKQARYADYKLRAAFVNFTTRTHDALNGAMHRQPAEIELPDRIAYMLDNADGAGSTLGHLATQATSELLIAGRAALLADYPQAPEGATAEQTAGLAATVTVWPAESLINWREDVIAGRRVLTLAVLAELVPDTTDEFGHDTDKRYRVLQLIDGAYAVTIYDEQGGIIAGPDFPRDGQGATFPEIPLAILGAYSNNAYPDVPPLYDLAALNLGHYRNSADFEESAFVVGQPSLFIGSDLSAQEFLDANPTGINLGSRSGHFLGKGGTAIMLQAQPNSMAREAMKDKEAQAVAIGAKLVGTSGQNETAEAARIRAAGEVSLLSLLAQNASAGIARALGWADRYMGGDGSGVSFELSREFFPDTLTAQDITAMMGLAESGDISQADLRDKLRRAGWLRRTDAEIDAAIIAQAALNGPGEDD